MAETKTSKLEQRVEFLEKELEGARDAIRRLFEQQTSFTPLLEDLRQKLTDAQVQLAQLQAKTSVYENSINRYE